MPVGVGTGGGRLEPAGVQCCGLLIGLPSPSLIYVWDAARGPGGGVRGGPFDRDLGDRAGTSLAGRRGFARPSGIWLRTRRQDAWEAERKHQSSQRNPVGHAIAELKWWRQLHRFTGRRELLSEIRGSVAALESDCMITW